MRLQYLFFALFSTLAVSACPGDDAGGDGNSGDGTSSGPDGGGSAGSSAASSGGGDLPACPGGGIPWAEIDNGCDYEISLDGMTLVSGSCDGPGGVSHGENADAQLSAQHATEADASPFETFSLSLTSQEFWDDLEGFDSTSTEPAEVSMIATVDYYRATKRLADAGDVIAALLDEQYLAVSTLDCGVLTMVGVPVPDAAPAFKIDSAEARCFDSFSKRTFFEVHGSLEGECKVTRGNPSGSTKVMATVKVTF